jgi:integrase/recombinase XerC
VNNITKPLAVQFDQDDHYGLCYNGLKGNGKMSQPPMTIASAVKAYLDSIIQSRSANTARTYRIGMDKLIEVLKSHHLDPKTTDVGELHEDAILWLINNLRTNAPTTERLYITAVTGFYEFLAGENLADINLPRIRLLIRQRARRPGQRLPQFPREAIEKVLDYAASLAGLTTVDADEHLRNLRDRAFILTLADTGLRVHEACALRRGDIDWNENRAVIIGKGNKQAVIRFSKRSQAALRDYLSGRSSKDGSSGRPLSALPLFARHDRGAGKKVKPITTTTGRNIVSERVKEALGAEALEVGNISPHSFRHYFVTTILLASGNLKMAQELARHSNIAVTQRYAHLSDDELDKGYWEIFNENRPEQ